MLFPLVLKLTKLQILLTLNRAGEASVAPQAVSQAVTEVNCTRSSLKEEVMPTMAANRMGLQCTFWILCVTESIHHVAGVAGGICSCSGRTSDLMDCMFRETLTSGQGSLSGASKILCIWSLTSDTYISCQMADSQPALPLR